MNYAGSLLGFWDVWTFLFHDLCKYFRCFYYNNECSIITPSKN